MMNNFFRILLGNLLLNRGPQDFPYSSVLMRLCLLANFVTGLPVLLSKVGFEYAVLAMALDISVLLLFVYLSLQAFSKPERYVQSITALAGVGVVFQLIAYLLLNNFEVNAEAAPTQEMTGFAILFLMFFSWYLAVHTHIFKQAFGVRLPVAMVLTVCYFVISQLASGLFLPELQ